MNKDKLILNDAYKDYLLEVEKTINDKNLAENNLDLSDTPLSPMLISDEHIPVMLMPEVGERYRQIVSLIDDENKDTALEYGYILLGKQGVIGGEECLAIYEIIDCSTTDLFAKSITYDQEKIRGAQRLLVEKGYNFISLAHTHPKTKRELQESMLANYLQPELKEKGYIRDAGLNISLQDVASYETGVYEPYKGSNVHTASAVIMYNGEIAMFTIKNNSLRRYIDITDLSTGEPVYVSRKEDYKKKI